MNLLLFEASELSQQGELRISGTRARHMLEVWKIQLGSDVRVGCIDGAMGMASVVAIDGEHVQLRARLTGAPPARPRVDLIMALPRPKVLKRLWAPLASLGIGTIALTNASRVERFYFDSHALSPEVVRERLLDGLAQARDTIVPRVEVRHRLKPFVEDELDQLFPEARRLLADPVYERSITQTPSEARVVLALGPEGGWTPYERDLFERNGFVGIGLGPRALRSDTAAIVLTAMAHETIRVAQKRG